MHKEYNHYFDFSKPLHPYTGSSPINPDTACPLSALRSGEEKLAISPGSWPCESNGKIIYVDDHRGEEGYINGRPFVISDVGPYPQGWSTNAPELTEEEQKKKKIAEIEGRLMEIDQQSVRPLRAILDGTASDFDKNKLKELENKAEELRAQLTALV